MQNYTKFEKILYTILVLHAVFIFGVQVGIAQSKELQRHDYYEYSITNIYLMRINNLLVLISFQSFQTHSSYTPSMFARAIQFSFQVL